MMVTTEEVRNVVSMLDDIVKEYREEHPAGKRDWRTYEQRVAERLKTAFRELKPLVHEAVSSISFVSGETRGAKPSLTVEQRTLALLIKHIIGKSNRNMAAMFTVFSLLSDIDVSYKTVERFYSDQEIQCALHNLHMLMLRKKGVEQADCGGDGTGYALTIKKHYATEAQKLKDRVKQESKQRKKRIFSHSFRFMDIKTRMYIATGTSMKSEQEAFLRALQMVKDVGIKIASVRLDRYFSAQAYVRIWEEKLGKAKLYLIPKTSATIKGPWEWKRMLRRLVQDVKGYLKEYFQRNQSESGFAEDKKRTGWRVGQKRPDRIDTADMLTMLWHNLHWLA